MKRTVSILALITLFFLAVSLIIFPLINKHYDNENGMKIVVINRIIAEARTAVANGNAVTISDSQQWHKHVSGIEERRF